MTSAERDPAGYRKERDPTISGFLERYPSLREPTGKVLACAAVVREAKERALVPGQAPDPGPGFRETERELVAAVDELERLARADSPSDDEILACAERVLSALLRMRAGSHTFNPRRRSSSPQARTVLFRALAAFNHAWAALEDQARACHAPRIPWQIELATHVAPGTPVAAIEITGYELPQTPAARRAWGERCFLSGTQWLTDSHPTPAIRYRSLDSCSRSLAPRYHALCARLRAALDSLRTRCPHAGARIIRCFPAIAEDYVAEPACPTFVRLGLFDYPSLAITLNNLLRTYASRPFLGTRGRQGRFPSLGMHGADAGYGWETYDDVRGGSLRLAYGLERLGLAPGTRLGIIATRNCSELYLADFAAIFAGLVSVGLQDTLSDEQLLAVMRQAELRAVVADDASLERVLGLADRCPSIRRVVAFDSVMDELPASWSSASGVSLRTGVVYGDEAGYRSAAEQGIRADGDEDVYTILFTSGSTGTPKGTLVSRRRWAREMSFDVSLWPHVSASFLPPALAADRRSLWRTMADGGRVGFARRGAALFADLRSIRPTVFDAPPLIWNALCSEYRRALRDLDPTPRAVAALRRRLRSKLGGRLAAVATGGASSDPAVRQTMEAIFGVAMTESYGTTETGTIAAGGTLVPGVEYRLVDVPEMGFFAKDQRGELAVRTPHLTARYLNEARDDDAFTADGYFLTGDVVELGPGRRCTIIGRRKQLFKLAGSEFIAPEVLERHYLSSELVEAVLITGSPLRSAVVAVVVPARDEVTAAEVLVALRAVARRRGLRPGEIPAGVVIAPRVGGAMPWTVDNGLLTPALKLNRRTLEEKYRDQVEAAYADRESVRSAAAASGPAGEDLTTVSRRLAAIVAGLLALPPAEVDVGRSFVELGGDSQSAMELVLHLEQAFSGQDLVAGSEDSRWLVESPLAEVAHRLAGRRPGPADDIPPPAAPAATVPAEESAAIAGEAQAAAANADAAAVPLPAHLPPAADQGHVFLTGATGFLGIHLLAHLASSLPRGTRIYALARATSDEKARDRLQSALRDAALEPPVIGLPADGEPARVVAVAGSLAESRLGLTDEVYSRLASEVGLIYHVGAEVSIDKSYARLRGPNVEGTRRVMELATATALKTLHFVSSLNVTWIVGQSSGRRVYEESPLPRRLSERIAAANPGYAVSKWVGERMLQELFSHCGGALRASVSRPALITWSQATGYANASDWLTRVLASCLRMRRAIGPDEVGVPRWAPETPVSARGLDMVPVDFAARAVARLGELTHSSTLPAPSRPAGDQVPTFQVSNIAPAQSGLVTLPHLMDMLAAADLRYSGLTEVIEYVPFSEWLSLAETAAEPLPVLPVLAQLRRMSTFFERSETSRFAGVVAGLPGGCPPFDQALVDTFVSTRG